MTYNCDNQIDNRRDRWTKCVGILDNCTRKPGHRDCIGLVEDHTCQVVRAGNAAVVA